MNTVVFDVDDTLNNLLENTLRLANIDKDEIRNITKYNLVENKNLTKEQIETIFSLWKRPYTYETCEPHFGIRRINNIIQRSNVLIHSHCTTVEVAEAKIKWVQKYLALSRKRFIMDAMDLGKPKTHLENVDIVVEDNLQYLLNYNAKHKILITKYHNNSDNYGIRDEDYNITRVNSLLEAIEIIEGVLGKDGENESKSV